MPFKLHTTKHSKRGGRVQISKNHHAKEFVDARKKYLELHIQMSSKRIDVHNVPVLKNPVKVAGHDVRVFTFKGAKHYVDPTGILKKLPTGGKKKGGKSKGYDGTIKLRKRKYMEDEPGDEWIKKRGKPTVKSTSERGINLIER